MTFGEELKLKSESKFRKVLDEFINELKPKLVETAESGYNSYVIECLKKDEDIWMFYNRHGTIAELMNELPGVKVLQYSDEPDVGELKFIW